MDYLLYLYREFCLIYTGILNSQSFTSINLYFHVWIQYRSNTDPDPQHWGQDKQTAQPNLPKIRITIFMNWVHEWGNLPNICGQIPKPANIFCIFNFHRFFVSIIEVPYTNKSIKISGWKKSRKNKLAAPKRIGIGKILAVAWCLAFLPWRVFTGAFLPPGFRSVMRILIQASSHNPDPEPDPWFT